MLPWLISAAATALALLALRADRRRAALVARALHEVRGPLTAARLAVASAQRERRAAALGAVDRELAHAGELLRDLAAAPAGRCVADAVEVVDVAALLRRAANRWRPAARLRGRDVLVVAPGAGLTVRGDRGRLLQALSNLVANAVEHGGGLVVLGARADGDRVRLEVADGGRRRPGAGEAAADDGDRDAGADEASAGGAAAGGPAAAGGRGRPSGRGLGLAVTEEIAARHGGLLVAATGPAGTRFAVDLPLVTDDVGPAPAPAPATR